MKYSRFSLLILAAFIASVALGETSPRSRRTSSTVERISKTAAPLSAIQDRTYHVTDVGVPAGQQIISPAALNNNGQVVASTESAAYRYTNGVWENLGKLPGGNVSGSTALNNSGQVVGSSQYANGGAIRHATLFDNGNVTDMGTLLSWGNNSAATGINAAGQAVGSSGPGGTSTHAFLWDAANGMRDLGTLGGQYAAASSINSSGFVTGNSQVPTGLGPRHAFVWDEATGMQDLGTIAGDSSSGSFINDKGHVVGSSKINTFDNREHAFFYDGTMHDLGSLGPDAFESDRSGATAINNNDEIVGGAVRPYTGGALYSIAFVYRNGKMYDLEKLVDASGKDYRLMSAASINDAGQILVKAIHVPTNTNRAVLLTPNPRTFAFTSIIDNASSGFGDFGVFPSINDSGIVAFHGEQGSVSPGTYKSDGNTAPVFISDDLGGGGPSINNVGEVASRRMLGGEIEFFKGTGGGNVSPIAITGTANGAFRTFPGYVYLANTTEVGVFSAILNPLNPRVRGIYTGTGNGQTDVVVDNNGAFAYFGGDPTVNDRNAVAFTGTLDNTDEGIFLGTVGGHGATSTVILSTTSPLYKFDGSPFINSQGQIAFKANEDATGMPAIFTINSDGTNLRTVATASGPYSEFQAPAVNDLGSVAFIAWTDAGVRGIYTGANPAVDKVIAEGDALFGSTVTSVSFFRGLNNKDEIAFYYTLADQRHGIARARVATSQIVPVSVASRKGTGPSAYDVLLQLSGSLGIECRSGGATGDHQLVLSFGSPVTVNAAQVTAGTGQVGTGGSANGNRPTVIGTDVIVPLTNVANAQNVVITLLGVSDGHTTQDVSVSMGLLAGDTNGDGVVNSSDIAQVKSKSGQATDYSNFRTDLNADGSLNSGDIALVKSRSGTALP